METKICPICGKEYRSFWKTCSVECGNRLKGKTLRQKAIPLREKRMEERKHFCLTCGKELFDSRKFCSRSCAAKYNNRFREHKPWTEEQKQRVSRKRRLENDQKRQIPVQHCKYCGKEVQGKRTVCEECRPFVERIKTYEKLGLLEGPLVQRDCDVGKIIRNLYEEGLTIADMYQQFQLHNVTVRKVLREQGIELRSLAEEQRRNLEKGRKHSAGIRGTHRTWQGVEIEFRSSWEDRFMSMLDEEKVEYLYEPFRIRYWDSEKQIERIAIPDFYLPKTNELIELKSCWTYQGQEQVMRDKFKSYKDLGYNPKLLLDWNYVEIL